MRVVYSHDVDATENLGRRIAAVLKPGQVLAFHGDLGTGKTVISRGISRGLGVTEKVTSPTFTVVQEYPLKDGRYMYHLDMYRISDDNAAIAFGIDEFLFNPQAYTLVEWPERIPALLGNSALDLTLEHIGGDCRKIILPDELAAALEPELPEGITEELQK